MSKKTKQVDQINQDDFEAELKSEPQEFNGIALGILPKSDGGFNIVKVTLDVKKLGVGEVTVLDTAESKPEANEKFKINVIRQGVM